MRELGFNVPTTARSFGDRTSVLRLIRKTGEVEDRSGAIHGLVVQRDSHYTTTAPSKKGRGRYLGPKGQ